MRRWTWAALGLACVACCLPLLTPFLGAAGLAGGTAWLSGRNWAEIVCVSLIVGAAGALGLVAWRRARRRTDGPHCEVKD